MPIETSLDAIDTVPIGFGVLVALSQAFYPSMNLWLLRQSNLTVSSTVDASHFQAAVLALQVCFAFTVIFTLGIVSRIDC